MPTRYTHYLNGGPREKFPRARSKEGLRVERLRLGGWPRSTLGLDTGCDTWGGGLSMPTGEKMLPWACKRWAAGSETPD